MLNRQLLRKLKLPMNFISNLGGPTNIQLLQKGLHGYNMHPCSLAVASNPGFPFRTLSCSFGELIFSKAVRQIQNGKPGFEVSLAVKQDLVGLITQSNVCSTPWPAEAQKRR